MNVQNKILIVDDDTVNREFFQLILSKHGFVVEEAVDGVDALEKLNKLRPDLILLDNIMPRMSGFELTKILKEDPKYREIPIIMFSALDDLQDKLAGFELGVDDYITKPFNFSEVLARIKTTLRNRELFAQIVVRESRLNLAGDLYRDLKLNLADFTADIDDLDSIAAQVPAQGESAESLAAIAGNIQEKARKFRMRIAEMDARIEKTILETEDLRKNEMDLSTLEANIKKLIRQE